LLRWNGLQPGLVENGPSRSAVPGRFALHSRCLHAFGGFPIADTGRSGSYSLV
jgi:hypothetical protein